MVASLKEVYPNLIQQCGLEPFKFPSSNYANHLTPLPKLANSVPQLTTAVDLNQFKAKQLPLANSVPYNDNGGFSEASARNAQMVEPFNNAEELRYTTPYYPNEPSKKTFLTPAQYMSYAPAAGTYNPRLPRNLIPVRHDPRFEDCNYIEQFTDMVQGDPVMKVLIYVLLVLLIVFIFKRL